MNDVALQFQPKTGTSRWILPRVKSCHSSVQNRGCCGYSPLYLCTIEFLCGITPLLIATWDVLWPRQRTKGYVSVGRRREMLRHGIRTKVPLHAHGLRTIVARPLWWAPTRVRGDALATIQALDFTAHGLTTRIPSPLCRTRAFDGARWVGAVTTVSTGDIAHWSCAVGVEPPNVTGAGVRSATSPMNTSLDA